MSLGVPGDEKVECTCDISPVKYTSACSPTSIDPPEPAQMAIVRIAGRSGRSIGRQAYAT